MKQIKNKELVLRRRNQIMDAALELFLDKGFHATTIRDIAAKSGVNQGSLYDYVKNKDDIFRMLIDKMHRSDPDIVEDPPDTIASATNFKEYLESLMRDAWTRNKKTVQLTYRVSSELKPDSLRKVLSTDHNLVEAVSESILKFTDLEEKDASKALLMANFIVFLNAFVPLREWNMREFEMEEILRFAVEMITRMAKKEE